jgi:hypothetical protein
MLPSTCFFKGLVVESMFWILNIELHKGSGMHHQLEHRSILLANGSLEHPSKDDSRTPSVNGVGDIGYWKQGVD